MKTLPTTYELVKLLQNESKEVKSSTGGTTAFRSVMDFVTINSHDCTKKELAKSLEKEFSNDTLNEVKDIYSKIVIKDGFDKVAQDFHKAL